jgi:hypothetical protein
MHLLAIVILLWLAIDVVLVATWVFLSRVFRARQALEPAGEDGLDGPVASVISLHAKRTQQRQRARVG